MDERRRYEDLLDLIAELRRDLQLEQQSAERARAAIREELGLLRKELTAQMLTYWQGTAAALRQLSDWRVEDETRARAERAAERHKQAWRARIMIGLLLTLAALVFWARL